MTFLVNGEKIYGITATDKEIEGLTSLTIPAKVGKQKIKEISLECLPSKLKEREIPIKFEDGISSVEGFEGFAVTSVQFPASLRMIGPKAFWKTRSLKSIEFSSSTEHCCSIAQQAFSHSALESITFPKNILGIGIEAFLLCNELKTVKFENGLSSIGTISDNAFRSCSSLEYVEFPISNNIQFGNNIFKNCKSLREVVFQNNSTLYISDEMFSDCVSLEKINLPTSIEAIKNNAFYRCCKLANLDLEKTNLKVIGISAFADSGLKSLTFPDSLTKIGDYAFSMCQDLRKVDFPSGVSKIGCSAFDHAALEEVNWKALTHAYIENTAFCGCRFQTLNLPVFLHQDSMTNVFSFNHSLKSVNFEDGTWTIAKKMFSDCLGLCEVNLPRSLLEIKEEAFCNCGNIKQIRFPANLSVIEAYAFANHHLDDIDLSKCDGLTIEHGAFDTLYDNSNVSISPYTVSNDGYITTWSEKIF